MTPAEIRPQTASQDAAFVRSYLDTLNLVERLHRLLLDVIKDEIERLGILDVTPVQALLLFNVGDHEVTAGEIKSRGYYQASNVGSNLKKLVEMGYMHDQRSEVDRRSVRVSLTDKGRRLHEAVARLFAAHAAGLTAWGVLDLDAMDNTTRSLKRMERYWLEQIRPLQ